MKRWLPPLLLLLAVILTYHNAVDGPFLLDDTYSIVDNTAIRSLWPLSKVLNPPAADLTFYTRPIINLTMCVDYAWWELNPRGYHLSSLAFHLAAVWAFWAFLSALFRRWSFTEPEARGWALAAAVLWAVHPLATSAVNYPSQRGELAVGLFLFLMLRALDRAVARHPDGVAELCPPKLTADKFMEGRAPARPEFDNARWRDNHLWLILSFFACLLGMGSKESMLVAPVLALAYDRCFLSVSWQDMFRRRGVYYLALAVTALWPIRQHLAFSPHLTTNALAPATWWHHLPAQTWGLNRFIRLTFWPDPLVFDYGGQLGAQWNQVLMPALGLLTLLVATAWALVCHPRWGFAGLGFFAMLAPSVLLPVTGQPIAEHRMYVSLAFALMLLAQFARAAQARQHWPIRGLAAVVAGLVLLLGGWTVRRNRDYQSEMTLLSDTIAKWPFSARAFYNRGLIFHKQGDYGLAMQDYDRAVELEPRLVSAYLNRARIRFDLKNYRAALLELDKALEIQKVSTLYSFRGQVFAAMRQYDEAARSLEEALRLAPDTPGPRNDLAWLLATAPEAAARDGARGVQLANEALRSQPGNPRLLSTLAAALAESGRFNEAVAAAEQALALSGPQAHPEWVAEIKAQAESYKAHRPWRME